MADKPSTAKGKDFIVKSPYGWRVTRCTNPAHGSGAGKHCADNVPPALRLPDGGSGPSPTASPPPACTVHAEWWRQLPGCRKGRANNTGGRSGVSYRDRTRVL